MEKVRQAVKLVMSGILVISVISIFVALFGFGPSIEGVALATWVPYTFVSGLFGIVFAAFGIAFSEAD